VKKEVGVEVRATYERVRDARCKMSAHKQSKEGRLTQRVLVGIVAGVFGEGVNQGGGLQLASEDVRLVQQEHQLATKECTSCKGEGRGWTAEGRGRGKASVQVK
jgi:hypothetical protein